MFPRDGVNYDRRAATLACALRCEDESLTDQSSKDEADINVLMRRFGVTGVVAQSVRVPQYADFTDAVSDYQSAMNMLIQAQESFMAMPAQLRKELDNDPQKFLEWCSDEKNLPRMRELGLAVPAEPAPEKEPAAGDS